MSDTPTLEESIEKTRTLTTEEGDKIQEDKPEDSKPEATKEPKPKKVEEVSEEETEDKPKEVKSEKVGKPKKTDEVKEEEQPEVSKKEKETLDHIDPKEVPKELKPWYDKIMSGFTKGRQKDREAVKKLEKQLKARPKVESEPEELPKFNSPEEYYRWQAKTTAEEVVKTERQESFRQEALNYYNASDPRLNQDHANHDPIIDALIGSQLDVKLETHIKENGQEQGFDYKANIKQLLENWDQYLSGHIKNYISRQNKLTKDKAKEFKKKAPVKPNPAKTTFTKKLTLQESMNAALEKQK